MCRILAVLFLIFSLNVFGAEPEPGKAFFTVQVASFKEISKAREVLENIKDLPYARISYRNGRYKVRVGFFNSFSEAQQFVKENLAGRVKDYYITKIRFSPEGVFFAGGKAILKSEVSAVRKKAVPDTGKPVSPPIKPENKKNEKIKVDFSSKTLTEKSSELKKKKTETAKSDYQVIKEAQEELKKTDFLIEKNINRVEREKSGKKIEKVERKKAARNQTFSSDFKRSKVNSTGKRNFLPEGLGPVVALVGVVLLLVLALLRRKRNALPKDLEKLVAELLEEERCGELLETVLPLLPSQPDNTFLRKSVADCYVKLGKFLEAASLYEEIGEILDRKGLSVLADEFRKKAEELYGSEFKRRG